jgi:hypothetical protein
MKIEDDKIRGGKQFIGCLFSEKWFQYHKKYAQLRMLCKTCNCKLGYKDLF